MPKETLKTEVNVRFYLDAKFGIWGWEIVDPTQEYDGTFSSDGFEYVTDAIRSSEFLEMLHKTLGAECMPAGMLERAKQRDEENKIPFPEGIVEALTQVFSAASMMDTKKPPNRAARSAAPPADEPMPKSLRTSRKAASAPAAKSTVGRKKR